MNSELNRKHANGFYSSSRSILGLCAAWTLFCSITAPVLAGTNDGTMGKTTYVAMTGDVNNDGHNDVLMKAIPKIAMIPLDDDLQIPIQLPLPSPTFVLLSTGYGTYSLLTNPDAEMISRLGWAPASQGISYSGPSGAYSGSMTITSAAPDQASFVISIAADTGVLSITSFHAASGSGAAGTESYTYDSLGRLRTVTYPNGVKVTYVYDAAGNRSSRSATKQ